MPILPEALGSARGSVAHAGGPLSLARGLGSGAMGFVAAFGSADVARPMPGIVLSALVPLAAWPVGRLWLRRKARTVVVPVD